MSGGAGLLNCLPSQNPVVSQRGGGCASATCMEARSPAPSKQLCPRGSMLLAFASLLGCLLTSSHAKVYSRCELAKVLHDFGLEGYRGSTLADCEDCPPPPTPLPSLPALPPGLWSQKLSQPQPSFVHPEC